MSTEKEIKLLMEEAEAQLTLYSKGLDDYAIKRYEFIMERIKYLRSEG